MRRSIIRADGGDLPIRRHPAILLLAAVVSATAGCHRPHAGIASSSCAQSPRAAAPPPTTAVVTVAPGQIGGIVEVPPATRAVLGLEPVQMWTRTDAAGRFLFADVPPGRYVLVTYAFGSDAQRDTVALAPNTGVVVYVRPRRSVVCRLSDG